MVSELTPNRERAMDLRANPARVTETLEAGAEKARAVAKETITHVKERMGLPLARNGG